MRDRRNNLFFMGGAIAVLLILPLVIDNDKTLTIAILTFIIAALASSWNIVGGFAGFVEEECEEEAKERRRLEKESEPTEDLIDDDLFNPPEDDPLP